MGSKRAGGGVPLSVSFLIRTSGNPTAKQARLVSNCNRCYKVFLLNGPPLGFTIYCWSILFQCWVYYKIPSSCSNPFTYNWVHIYNIANENLIFPKTPPCQFQSIEDLLTCVGARDVIASEELNYSFTGLECVRNVWNVLSTKTVTTERNKVDVS